MVNGNLNGKSEESVKAMEAKSVSRASTVATDIGRIALSIRNGL
jgi:hypothetical protein